MSPGKSWWLRHCWISPGGTWLASVVRTYFIIAVSLCTGLVSIPRRERTLAEAVKVHGKGGYVNTWLFQSMVARQKDKHDEARRLLTRVRGGLPRADLRRQQRVWWSALLGEARKLIHTPPPMPKLAVGE